MTTITTMSIFISYRRDDSAGHAGRLFDRLAERYGRDGVFMDHDALSPGQDFHGAIESRLAKAATVLALIGPRWIDARDAQGARRLAHADDFVRRELLAAITSGTRVIPVLVGGARMPGERDLPPELAGLARLQAWELRDARWDDDVAALVARLPAPAAAPVATSVAARLAGEWVAEVDYPWGTKVTERFSFEADGDEVFGSATYLTGRHPLEKVELLDDGMRFTLYSEVVLGDESRRVEHTYRARLDGDTLHIRMHTSGGFNDGPPMKITARRRE